MTGTTAPDSRIERPLKQALWRGLRGCCPCCGNGALFSRYLTVVEHCEACFEDFSHQRADDAPPYIVITIVGHIVVALALATESQFHPPYWLHLSLWLPLTLILALGLLQPVKGMIVALQWANRMHGFAAPSAETLP